MMIAGALRFALGLAVCLLTGGALLADSWLPLLRTDLTAEERSRVSAASRPSITFERPEAFEANQGGAGTTSLPNADGRHAFGHPAKNLEGEDGLLFEAGKALFEKLWVASPSSTQASDGLGPLYNARSCASCHIRNGRGQVPDGVLVRLDHPPRSRADHLRLLERSRITLPDPVYGDQFQDRAVPGLRAEGTLNVTYDDQILRFPDGETVTLRRPQYHLTDLNFGPLAPETKLLPRLAPPMIGLGLIEAIHPSDLLGNADPFDHDGDGVSGRLAWVLDQNTERLVPGRFGWKASQASLRAQNAAAFHADIGISTPLKRAATGDCTPLQSACLSAPDGEQSHLGVGEAPDPVLDLVTLYSATIAVPRRRSLTDPEVLQGKRIFHENGCATCHRPKYVTRRDAGIPANAFQLIWPYSDFLLHDMGPELADGRSGEGTIGSEWRTPPLWGIGLTEAVGNSPGYLHDGRARNLTEAILWHGGEAAAARDRYMALPKEHRDALLSFLRSL